MRSLALLAIVVIGCDPKPTTPASPAAAVASKEEAPVTRTNGPCLATTAKEAPDGWTSAGKLVITVKKGHPTKLTVTGVDGKEIASETPADENKMRAQIGSLTCRADAWLAIPPSKPPADKDETEVVFDLARPRKNDEAADIALLCTIPKEANDPSATEAQRAMVAASIYSESLSSLKFRGWFYELDRELGAAKSETDGIAVKQAHGQKLVGLLKGSGANAETCWFAKVLAAGKR